MNNNRQLFIDTINGKKTNRVPVGLWWHFTSKYDQFRGLEDENIIKKSIAGHKRMYETLSIDFAKIMPDGFLGHPHIMENGIESIDDIKKIKSIGKDSPWYDKQIQVIKDILKIFNYSIFSFYTIFSPLSYIRLYCENYKQQSGLFNELFLENPDAMLSASDEIAKDVIELAMRIKKETEIDGIYYSVQSFQSATVRKDFHDKYFRPSDMKVLDILNGLWQNNILHICGHGEFKNDLTHYVDYNAKIYNWAVHTEKISLEEGRKLFNNSCVLGGFDNNSGTLLDTGTRDEIKKYVCELIENNGKEKLIIGADCTISEDLGYRVYDTLRDVVKECCK